MCETYKEINNYNTYLISNLGNVKNKITGKLLKLMINKDGKIIKLWNSIKEVGESLKINVHNISYCCSGKLQSAGGYVWNYEVVKNV